VGFKVKKPRKSITDNGLHYAIPDESRRGDNCVTIEVVSLKDMPLLERRREANKPLYLTRYE
jgi:hypothetical protein